MKPFLFVREAWPKKTPKENSKSSQAQGSVSIDKQMYVLFGDKPPELLMFWELKYKMCITKDDIMAPIAKLNVIFLKYLVKNNTLGAVENGTKLFEHTLELSNINNFRNLETKISIERLYNSDQEKKKYLAGNAQCKSKRYCY